MSRIEFLVGSTSASIQVDASQSVLEQALAQGVAINYSCKRGDCGQCVAMLLAGEVEPIDDARPCIGDEGVYLCNACARSDLTIRLPYSPETEHIKVLRSPCKLHELNHLSNDVIEASFRLPPSTNFTYVPGQYVRLTNKERVTRSYSFAEPPAADKFLRIHVRQVDEGAFSRYLFSAAKPGDLLHLEGPFGRFVLPDNTAVSKTIFLATGTGIAPTYAILASLTSLQRERCGELFLYWGNRREKDAYHQNRIAELAQRLGVEYFSVLSRESDKSSPGAVRHVQDLMAKHHDNLSDAQVFASGNVAMINEARKQCSSLGLPIEYFRADPFTSS